MGKVRRRSAAVLTAVAGLCAGCVAHASPEAMALLERGRAALDGNDHAAAVDRASEFLSENAKTAEAEAAYYIRGLGRWRTGDVTGAREDLETAASRARTGAMHYRAVKALGDLAMETNDNEGAITLYKQALGAADPNAPALDEVRYGLGCAYQRLGRWWQADGQFDRLLHEFPDSPTAPLANRRIRCQAWTFQVAAHGRKGAADDESARLGRVGLTTRIRPVVVDDRLVFFVESGRYDTRAEAAAKAEWVRRFAAGARIVPTK